MDKRPKLNKTISTVDFKEYYWLKEELIDFCRSEKLSSGGTKIEIFERIEHYLNTGKKQKLPKKQKSKSSFNWKSNTLTINTIITENYNNSENVRTFFTDTIGKNFKFNVQFMNWMKNNTGKTLDDAIHQYKQIIIQKQTPIKRK